jgi:hypothetical protein
MVQAIRRLFILIAGWLVVSSQPLPRPQRPRVEELGVFYFKNVILDQLDQYFTVLKRMKRASPDEYRLYSRLGAHVIPCSGVNHLDEICGSGEPLSPWFRQTLPAFGAVTYCMASKFSKVENMKVTGGRSLWFPRLLLFRKYSHGGEPPEVQRLSGGATLYVVTVYFDRPDCKDLKAGIPQEFPVAILPDGSVRVLRCQLNGGVAVLAKHGSGRGSFFHIPQKRWGIWDHYHQWAREVGRPVEELLTSMFVRAANFYVAANASMIRVEVSRGGLVGVFGVDIVRTPYFFKDRDVTVGPTGYRKKIFHIVRPHRRESRTGRESFVRLHFRGERSFNWNGYQVGITVPGKHHANLADFNVGMWDKDKALGQGFLGATPFAKWARKHLLEQRPEI